MGVGSASRCSTRSSEEVLLRQQPIDAADVRRAISSGDGRTVLMVQNQGPDVVLSFAEFARLGLQVAIA